LSDKYKHIYFSDNCRKCSTAGERWSWNPVHVWTQPFYSELSILLAE